MLLTALLCRTPAAVLRRLKSSNADIDRAARIESGPEAPVSADQASVRRWLSEVGPAADDLLQLWSLRHGSEAPWADAVAEIRRRGDPLSRSDLAITGADLQSLGVTGPAIGRTLTALLDRVLEEPALNTRDSLLGLARKMS